jgi:hypothetical protein
MKVDPKVESGIPVDSDEGFSETDIEHEKKPVPKHGALVSKGSNVEPKGSVMTIQETHKIRSRMTFEKLQAIRAFKQEPNRR